MKHDKGEQAAPGKRRRRLNIIVFGVISGIIVTTVLVAGGILLAHRREQRHRRVCSVNLKNGVGFELLMYSSEHGGRFPDALWMLAEEDFLRPSKAWVCPGSGTPAPKTVQDIKNGQCDYIYLGSGLTERDCQQWAPGMDIEGRGYTVLLYEKASNHGGNWMNVFLSHGMPTGVEAKTIEEAARKRGWILPERK